MTLMDKIDKFLQYIIPASFTRKMIRYIISLHPYIAKKLFYLMTRPFGAQKKYICKVNNKHWEGALIMPDASSCNEETATKRLQASDVVIFNIHGGGFRSGHSTMYMKSFIGWLDLFEKKHNMNACIMSIDYVLAPEHAYPTALLQCVKAYKHLVQDLGVSPSKIIFSGDSAGGALVVETLVRTYADGLLNNHQAPRTNFEMSLPAGALLVSPLVSGNDASLSWYLYQNTDVVSRALRQLVLEEYIFRPDAKMEELALLNLGTLENVKDFDRFLPKEVMVAVGTVETMRDDILAVAGAIERDGHNVTLVQENYPHDWFFVHGLIPREERHLIIDTHNERFVDFCVNAVRNHIDDSIREAPYSPTSTIRSVDDEVKKLDIVIDDIPQDRIEYTYTIKKRTPQPNGSFWCSKLLEQLKISFLSDWFFGKSSDSVNDISV